MYHGLQNCTDVLEAVHDSSTDMCVTASDIKVEDDPLAVTSPAVKAEQEVSNVCITCECWDSTDACCGIVKCCVLVSCVPEVDSLMVF